MANRERKQKNNPGNYAADLLGNELAQKPRTPGSRRGRNGEVRIHGVTFAQDRLFSGEDMRIPFPDAPVNKIPDRIGQTSEPGTLFSKPSQEPQGNQNELFPTSEEPAREPSPTSPDTPRRSVRRAETAEPTGEYPSHDSVSSLRERIARYGVPSLSNADLLEVILRTGQASEPTVRRAQEMFSDHRLPQFLRFEYGELVNQYGLGEAAATLQAVMEYARRLTRPTEEERYQIRSPLDAVTLLAPEMAFLDHEEMRVLVLDSKNWVTLNALLYKGTVNSSVVRTAEIFRLAVSRNCPGVLLAHNHPSGDPTPSPEDLAITQQLVEAGKLLEIELMDHIIIGRSPHFVSLKERLMW